MACFGHGVLRWATRCVFGLLERLPPARRPPLTCSGVAWCGDDDGVVVGGGAWRRVEAGCVT